MPLSPPITVATQLALVLGVALCASAARAAPVKVQCLKAVTFSFDDAQFSPPDKPLPPDGPCDLALHGTPDGNWSLVVFSAQIGPKDLAKTRKLKPEQRLQKMADMLAKGNSAAPVQDVEPVGPFFMAFSAAPGPSGQLALSHIATTWVGDSMIFVVLSHQAGRNPNGPAFDRASARNRLLSMLAGFQIAAMPRK